MYWSVFGVVLAVALFLVGPLIAQVHDRGWGIGVTMLLIMIAIGGSLFVTLQYQDILINMFI